MRWSLVFVASIACASGARAQSCPLRKVSSKAPALLRANDLDAARKLLLKGSSAMEHEADVVAPAKTESAFKADVRRAWEEGGDSSYWDTSAVFVLAKGVVIASRLVKWSVVLPPKCRQPLQDEIVAVKLVATGKRQLGIVRIRRPVIKDKPTLPAVAVKNTQTDCTDTATYRIEDHVIDLDKRRELLVLAGAYEGPVYEDHAPPLATLALTDREATLPNTSCKFALRP